MSDDARRDREAIFLAILIGVFAALVILLVVMLLARSGGDGEATPTTAAPATTSAATTTAAATTTVTTAAPTTTVTTAAPSTTAATTTAATTTTTSTTTTSTTTTTTTTVPFSGDTDWKGCTASGLDADTVSDVRFSQREGFTRVVFDFTGGVPGCTVGYADPHTLVVIVHPVDIANPFAAGIFDGSGQLQVGAAASGSSPSTLPGPATSRSSLSKGHPGWPSTSRTERQDHDPSVRTATSRYTALAPVVT